ncbi:CASP8 and FADD-like apoptosis regulator [Oreochromis niloticus]|uniref:CASP8 and FADD-like apoptosis regulator n=1 Tax=Oreochromis niloticus TaxID=8128 RepID=UPI000904DD4C|nr:CASP8 and FADD-like apoptosis regulator [Oreochromis niloticus]
MAVPEQFQLHAINEIAEALSSNERSRLFYLCESLDTDHSVACMKEMLRSKVTHHQNAHLFLAQLMFCLGRLDILRKVCKVSRDDLERTRQMVPSFRVLMAELSEELDTGDLDNVKFLLTCKLSREKLEKTKSFLDIIVELEKLDSVSPERLDVVEECLRNIGRIDLVKKLTTYKNSEKLEQTFKALHFSVDLHRYLSSDDVFSAPQVILGQKEKLRNDSFVYCIVSCGTESRLFGTDSTGNGFAMDGVGCLFNVNKCPLLADKPKPFFIQRYNIPEFSLCPRVNHSDEHLETDGCDVTAIPTDVDVIWSHCWTDEHKLEEEEHRSFVLFVLWKTRVDVQTEESLATVEHSRRNPEESSHLDEKHTLRKSSSLWHLEDFCKE